MKENTTKILAAGLGIAAGTGIYFILRAVQPYEDSSNKALAVLAGGTSIPVAYDEIRKWLRGK